ncbi:MAG TPA: hypothetical protein VEC37_10085 [Bacillota bacterium]|nr:hypothetical protein [Bacillota bacterium]
MKQESKKRKSGKLGGIDSRVYYKFTDEFVAKQSFRQKMMWVYFGISMLVAVMIFVFIKQPWGGILGSCCSMAAFLPLLFGKVDRIYRSDAIYIEDGLIHYIKYIDGRRLCIIHYIVNKVTQVVWKANKITIYGDISYKGNNRCYRIKKIVWPDAIEKRDELINYAKSQIGASFQTKAGRNVFEYTDRFLRKEKWLMIWAVLKPLLLLLMLLLLPQIKQPLLESFRRSLDLLLKAGIIIGLIRMVFYEARRKYSQDEIYVEHGMLHYVKSYLVKGGYGSYHLILKNITRVRVTKTKIKVYGQVEYDSIGIDTGFAKIVFPAEIKNRDALLEFAHSSIRLTMVNPFQDRRFVNAHRSQVAVQRIIFGILMAFPVALTGISLLPYYDTYRLYYAQLQCFTFFALLTLLLLVGGIVDAIKQKRWWMLALCLFISICMDGLIMHTDDLEEYTLYKNDPVGWIRDFKYVAGQNPPFEIGDLAIVNRYDKELRSRSGRITGYRHFIKIKINDRTFWTEKTAEIQEFFDYYDSLPEDKRPRVKVAYLPHIGQLVSAEPLLDLKLTPEQLEMMRYLRQHTQVSFRSQKQRLLGGEHAYIGVITYSHQQAICNELEALGLVLKNDLNRDYNQDVYSLSYLGRVYAKNLNVATN